MTKQELVKYARLTYNLSVTAKFNKTDLIHLIKDAAAKFKGNQDFQTAEQVEEDGLQPGYAEIQLHRTETTKGLQRVIVSPNGTASSLPIGERFACPIELVQILDDAVRIEYEKNPDTDELEERKVHAYPYTLYQRREHTPLSAAKSAQKRGFKGRPPRELWDEKYAEKLRIQKELEKQEQGYLEA